MATLPGVHKVPDVTLKRGVMSADDGAFDFAAAPAQAAGGTFFDGRLLTGDDPEVREYVLKSARGAALLQRLRDWLAFLLPLYDAEGKAYLTIGIGCTGGRHRSVAIASALAEALRASGRGVNIEHRDVGRGA